MIPGWILDIFAAVMLAVAAVSAARLIAARPWLPGAAALADIDVAHLLMAIAMAGMLTASLQTLPGGAWEVIFGVLTAWFAYRVVRDWQVSGVRALAGGHCAPHLIHAVAMLYMFVALTAPAAHGAGMSQMSGGMSGMGTLGLPGLAYLFALLLIGYSVWDLDQLSGPGVSGHYSLAAARVGPAGLVLAGAGAAASGAGAAASGAAASGAAAATAGAAATGAAAAGAESRAAALAGTPGAGSGASPGAGSGASPVAVSPAVLPRAADQLARAVSPVLAPWVATGCRIAMGVTMAFMLLILI